MNSRRLFARASLAAIIVGGAVAFSAPALAAGGFDEFGAYGGTHERGTQTESAQTMAVELRVGRYVPNVDSEFQTATPYKDMFGTSNRYSIGIEVDWQALRIPYFGTFGIGGSIGYTKSTAYSLVARDNTRSGEKTGFTIIPAYAVGVLRADYVARHTPIPLVPYAKLGLGAAAWSVSNGGGTSKVGNTVGTGLSTGPQFALGAMLLLDVFDPDAAMDMDNDVGINNSYVFAEWYVSDLNGFGSKTQMQVGTNTWVLGLAFEM
jgi:hypothetical protein